MPNTDAAAIRTEASRLDVSEVFGPTVQGEGPTAGRRCGFVRLYGCNLDCVWCDSAYTWDTSRYDPAVERTEWTAGQVVTAVAKMDVDRVVITGGEPLIQKRGLARLIEAFGTDVAVEIETNGTIPPGILEQYRWVTFNVSPKLPHAGVTNPIRSRPLADFARLAEGVRAIVKIVCHTSDDVAAAVEIADTAGFPRSAVWISPLGTTRTAVDTSLAAIGDAAVAAGVNLSPRLHIQTWGDERGR